MNELSSTDLQIVGFNGAPLVECGRAIPIARRESDGAHAVLDFSAGSSALNWHGEGEAESFLASGRWTRFLTPVFVPRACCDAKHCITDQPMVIYADEAMLDTADRLPRPPMPSGEYMIWRRLESHPETIQAACASAATVESLLDNWAAALLTRFDAMYRIGRDRAYLKRIADFALCAAREKDLRWRAFSYYATVQDPERVRRTFDTFTPRENNCRALGNLAVTLLVGGQTDDALGTYERALALASLKDIADMEQDLADALEKQDSILGSAEVRERLAKRRAELENECGPVE